MNTKILVTIASLGIIGLGMFGTTKAYAENAVPTNPVTGLVQKIATKFGLQVSDVQAMFDQEREQRKVEMEERYMEILTKAVSDGKLTEAQKQLVIAKRKELLASRPAMNPQAMQGKTVEERQKLREERRSDREVARTALEQWATQNGIDINYLMGGFGGPRGNGRIGNP